MEEEAEKGAEEWVCHACTYDILEISLAMLDASMKAFRLFPHHNHDQQLEICSSQFRFGASGRKARQGGCGYRVRSFIIRFINSRSFCGYFSVGDPTVVCAVRKVKRTLVTASGTDMVGRCQFAIRARRLQGIHIRLAAARTAMKEDICLHVGIAALPYPPSSP